MADTFKDHFSSRAAQYAAFRPSYPPELADYLASLVPERSTALDCGCGTGQLSALLATRFARVIATDASAEQIANAKPHERISYRQAPAEKSGLDDVSVDLVTVAQAAHWFDLHEFYAEVRRVLRPHAALVLITYGVIEADGPVGEAVSRFYYEIIGPYWPPERQHVETGYRLLPFPFREETAPRLAMRATWSLDALLGYVDTWSAVRQAEKALGRKPVDDFAMALRAAWGEPALEREIRWPLNLRVGRV
jgi:SAM-dependent methyltransferase